MGASSRVALLLMVGRLTRCPSLSVWRRSERSGTLMLAQPLSTSPPMPPWCALPCSLPQQWGKLPHSASLPCATLLPIVPSMPQLLRVLSRVMPQRPASPLCPALTIHPRAFCRQSCELVRPLLVQRALGATPSRQPPPSRHGVPGGALPPCLRAFTRAALLRRRTSRSPSVVRWAMPLRSLLTLRTLPGRSCPRRRPLLVQLASPPPVLIALWPMPRGCGRACERGGRSLRILRRLSAMSAMRRMPLLWSTLMLWLESKPTTPLAPLSLSFRHLSERWGCPSQSTTGHHRI
mmetsp:Transcript_44556/g.131556  ORF Transcript_44556/g.131556 Transcript_44556/m.131556 type:complete len:292 (+) Transcript_44556:251-1126(+)